MNWEQQEKAITHHLLLAKVGHNISDSNINNAEEALVLLLELFLVKDLDSEDAAFICAAIYNY